MPMRNRIASGILHWKMMLFAGQGQLEFAGANFAPFEFVPSTPYVNYTDEVIFYTNTQSLVNSFMRKFDDLWTSTHRVHGLRQHQRTVASAITPRIRSTPS